jgi:uncharacterized membrane protein YidH (DUF202 family)
VCQADVDLLQSAKAETDQNYNAAIVVVVIVVALVAMVATAHFLASKRQARRGSQESSAPYVNG